MRDSVITREPIPGSKKIYVLGQRFADVRVPMREVELAPTRSQLPGGKDEINPPVTLYDTSGKHVSEVFSGHLEAGAHELDFETRVPAGTYVLHCELGGRRTATKVVVLN